MSEDARNLIFVVMAVVAAVLVVLAQAYLPQAGAILLLSRGVDILVAFAPIWGPPVFWIIFWKTWVIYTFALQESKTPHVLLEIRLPKEVLKTPVAAELMLSSLWFTSGGETTPLNRFWEGKRRMWFSIEMVSFGGDVHFYIWTRSFYRNAVEVAIYGQYPDVEIHEVDDYTLPFTFDPEKQIVWGCEFSLAKPDAYPIKTYIDYGLDSAVLKEEQKADPLASLIEYLGACHPGGQIWIQILAQAHRKEKRWIHTFFPRGDWRDDANALVDKLMYRDPKTKGPRTDLVSPQGFYVLPSITKQEQEVVAAIQRSLNKQAFNVGIRGIYLADKGTFNAINIVALMGCLRQFSSVELNSFIAVRWHATFDWPWQDYNYIRSNYVARKLIELYKRRAYFHPPYRQRPMVLTTEELATIFHLPGGVVTTPTLGRLLSKKAEPPPNLPV